MRKLTGIIVLCFAAIFTLSAQETLQKNVISSGGGEAFTADKTLQLTIGQPVIGLTFVDTIKVELGFWHLEIDTTLDQFTAAVRELKEVPLLSQNYPNPFILSTSFDLYVPQEDHIKISVFNSSGQLLGILVNRKLLRGTYRFTWEASGVPPGQYSYQMEASEYSITRKMIVVR